MKKIIIALTFISSLNSFCFESVSPLTQEQPYYATASSFRLREDFAGHAEGLREKVQTATNIVINFFETALEKNVIGIEHLQRLIEAQALINPITQDERNSDSKKLVYASQLNNLILKGSLLFDIARIKDWATIKVEELQRAEGKRKEVHEDTREIHIPMRFVPVPAGKYVDEITHEEYEIPEGIEIQATLVTQEMWFHVITKWAESFNKNFELGLRFPSFFSNEIGSIEVSFNLGKYGFARFLLNHNAPVENISWDDVQIFIKHLNQSDEEYEYMLPSIQEFLAFLQNSLGNTWMEKLQQLRSSESSEKPHVVISNSYIEIDQQRIWDIRGNLWQWTRDFLEVPCEHFRQMGTTYRDDTKNKRIHLVFGGSYATNNNQIIMSHLLRPIVYDNSKGEVIGFRLIRRKKNISFESRENIYLNNQIVWGATDCMFDHHWRWDAITKNFLFKYDYLPWMLEHKNEFNELIQHTLNIFDERYGHLNLLFGPSDHSSRMLALNNEGIQDITIFAYIPDLCAISLGSNDIHDLNPLTLIEQPQYVEKIELAYNQIEDVIPLSYLTNLKHLDLVHNRIKDISSLSHLVKLECLRIGQNPIEDFTALTEMKNLKILMLDAEQIKKIDAKHKRTNFYEEYESALFPGVIIYKERW